MSAKPRFLVLGGAALFLLLGMARAGDVHLTLPKRNQPTPVQKLNREGVRAVEKHQYARAKALFYNAYLLDPNDPFTLNNLGYIAELEGEVERAQRFYSLASEQASDAVVDQATSQTAVGKPLNTVAGRAPDARMKINQMNVAAIALLLKDRAPEADVLLQRALVLDSRNPFTLNNLGYSEEKEGEWEKALSFYQQAANVHSKDPVVVTINPKWRGKAISEVSAQNAENLRKLMSKQETTELRVARLNLRGVSALNRNDRRSAREDFASAYKLDRNDAFTLNNMGYVSEMDGDRETANYFYQRAEAARRGQNRVDVASRREAEGKKLNEVAARSNDDVSAKMQAELDVKRRQGGPILLKRRDNSVVTTDAPPTPAPPNNPVVAPPTKPSPADPQPPVTEPRK